MRLECIGALCVKPIVDWPPFFWQVAIKGGYPAQTNQATMSCIKSSFRVRSPRRDPPRSHRLNSGSTVSSSCFSSCVSASTTGTKDLLLACGRTHAVTRRVTACWHLQCGEQLCWLQGAEAAIPAAESSLKCRCHVAVQQQVARPALPSLRPQGRQHGSPAPQRHVLVGTGSSRSLRPAPTARPCSNCACGAQVHGVPVAHVPWHSWRSLRAARALPR